MTRVLPPQPDLDHLKNEAKSLHKSHAQRETDVCQLLRHLHRFAGVSDEEILSAEVSRTDVQFALAMDYGFDSWQAMRRTVLGAKTANTRAANARMGDSRINLLPWREELREQRKKGNVNLNQASRTMLGLDISSTSIKLLELSKTDSTYHVESFGVELLPAEAVEEKNISDVEVVGEAIGRLVQRCGTEVTDVAVAVAGSGVITKTIEMRADMSEDEREHQIVKDADAYLPLPLNEVGLDFEVKRMSRRSKESVEVLLAACRREFIDMRVAALEIGGLNARVVDIEAHCMQRACQLIHEQLGSDEIVAIVDVGATMTTLSVLAGSFTPFNREQLFGGKQLTDEIQRRYGRTFEDSELAKKRGGLPDDYEEEVLRPFKEAVAQQVQRALQVFYASSDYTAVDRIVLTGGSASIQGMVDLVAAKVGAATICANPIAGMELSPQIDGTALEDYAPALMMVCGLAMRSFD